MDVKKLRGVCLRDTYDNGRFDRERLTSAGVNFTEEKGELNKLYYHNMQADIDPRNPIAVWFQFDQDPGVEHEGFTIEKVSVPVNPDVPKGATKEVFRYKQNNPGKTLSQLEKELEAARAQQKKLSIEAELAHLRAENEKLKAEIRGEELKPAASE